MCHTRCPKHKVHRRGKPGRNDAHDWDDAKQALKYDSRLIGSQRLCQRRKRCAAADNRFTVGFRRIPRARKGAMPIWSSRR
jgi:hypothetical protein